MKIIHKKVVSGHSRLLKGQVVHLLGCGPSLATVELRQLAKTGRLFVCNGFAHSGIQCIYPMLYFLGDPLYGDIEYLASEGIIEKIALIYTHVTIFTSEGLAEVIGNYAARACKELDSTMLLLSSKFVGGSPCGPFKCTLSEGLEHYQNILVLMLQVAIFMNAKRICLHGFDFGNILGYPLNVDRHHFYSESHELQWDCSHHDEPGLKQLEFFRSAYLTLAQLVSLKEFAREKAIQIANHSPTTILETFDKYVNIRQQSQITNKITSLSHSNKYPDFN